LSFFLLLVLSLSHPNPAFSDNPHVLYPNGGESFVTGQDVTVSWTNPPGTASVTLAFSTTNGLFWSLVAQDLVGMDSYVWKPNSLTLQGLIRVSAYDSGGGFIGSDTSDGTFVVHGNEENVRFALHRKPLPPLGTARCDNPSTPTIEPNYSPNYDHIPCTEYAVNSPLGPSLVYVVVAQADPAKGIGSARFGIDYDGRPGGTTGLQYVQMTYCADGLYFPDTGEFGEFPAPKAGVTVLWSPGSCQREVIGDHGVHAVVGAFYVYAYSADLMQLTPHNNLSNHVPELSFGDCVGGFTNLLDVFPANAVSSLLGRVQFGEGTGGYTPCSETLPCSVDVAAISVDPNTLNLNSSGKFVSASIELPTGYDPSTVLLASVKLNGTVSATNAFTIGDFNNNGVPDFTVKFSRDDVDAVLTEGDQVQVTITGSVGDDCTFSGTASIRVIRPHVVHPNGGESYVAGARALLQWTNPNGWTVDHAQIHYSADGGDTWAMVADHVTSQSYVWAMPRDATQNGRLRVVLFDAQGVMGYDTSDGPFTISAATAVGPTMPTQFRLYQNAPNPFRVATRALFDLPQPEHVTIKVFDLNGRIVRVLVDDDYPAGRHEAPWKALDAGGKAVSAGIYFLNIAAGSFTDTKRMYLQK